MHELFDIVREVHYGDKGGGVLNATDMYVVRTAKEHMKKT